MVVKFFCDYDKKLNKREVRSFSSFNRTKRHYCNTTCQNANDKLRGVNKTSKANEAVRKNGFPKKRGKKIPHLHNLDNYRKISKAKTGIRIPKLQGKNHWNWKGGVDKGIWFSWEYKQWRLAVFKRDNFICVVCRDSKGGNLEADHIKPKKLFPELIFDVGNGQTLCENCHKIKTKEDIELYKLEVL